MARYTCLMCNLDDDYEMVTKTRQGSLGTDLSTLNALFDSGQFLPLNPCVHRKIWTPDFPRRA